MGRQQGATPCRGTDALGACRTCDPVTLLAKRVIQGKGIVSLLKGIGNELQSDWIVVFGSGQRSEMGSYGEGEWRAFQFLDQLPFFRA